MARLTCHKKHNLVPEIKADVSLTLITCDVCKKSEELVFHSCRACNYDVCEYCLWKHFVKAGLATKHTYSPARSNVKQGALLKFLSQDSLDVSQCPGIGPVLLTTLQNHGIETLYQLMGFFARYRGLGVTQEQWTQAFYTWLIFQGANAAWAHTVTTVLADKLSILFDPAVCPVFNVDTFGRCDPNKLLPLPRRKRVNFSARSSAFDLTKSKMTNAKISDFIANADALALGPLAKVSKPRLKSSIGFGPNTCKELAKAAGVTNLFQLAGVFLQLRSKGLTREQFLNTFYRWLIERGASPGYAATITDAVRQWAEVKLTQLYKAAVARARHGNRASEPKPSNSMSGTASDSVGHGAAAAASTADYLSGDSSSVSATDDVTTAIAGGGDVGSAGVGSGSVAASMIHEASSSFGIGGSNAQPVKPSALESMTTLNDALPSASAPISRSTSYPSTTPPTFTNPILPPTPPEGEKATTDPSSCVVS